MSSVCISYFRLGHEVECWQEVSVPFSVSTQFLSADPANLASVPERITNGSLLLPVL